MRTSLLPLIALVALGACRSEPPVDTAPLGPARVQMDTVRDHAAQFEEKDLRVRAPGSQEELAAASYILGHLQEAGYVPLLDPVPVGDLVESTNVVALPLEGGEPTTVVAVSYGSTDGGGGATIGAFLEVARALNVARPGHTVAFVALGAEDAPQLGGSLGTRRLLKYLSDEGFAPSVITLRDAPALSASGDEADAFVERTGVGRVVPDPAQDVFAEARLDHTEISGPAAEVGPALLDYLED